jgi:zinc protease
MNIKTEKSKLNSGIEILFVDVPNQEIVDFSVIFRAGYYYCPLEKHEISHYLEHLSFDGTAEYPSKLIFAEAAEKNGAYWNATTSSYRVRYFFQSAKTEVDDLLKMILSQVYSPLFKKSDFEAEGKVIRNEINRRIASDRWLAAVISGNLVTPRIIEPRQRLKYLETITLKDIKNFHKKNYVKNNTFIVISGDLNNTQKQSIIKRINELTQSVPKGKRNKIIKPPMNDFKSKVVAHRGTSQQEAYHLSFINPEGTMKDSEALKIFSTILNGGFSSRIFHNIRESGLSYGTESGFAIREDYSEFYLNDYVDTDRSLRAFEKAFSIVKSVAGGDFSDKELERAKGYARGKTLRSNITSIDLAGWYMNDFVMERELIDIDDYISSFEKVTKDDVVAVAKKYIKPDNWVLAVVGKEAGKKKSDYKKIIEKYR